MNGKYEVAVSLPYDGVVRCDVSCRLLTIGCSEIYVNLTGVYSQQCKHLAAHYCHGITRTRCVIALNTVLESLMSHQLAWKLLRVLRNQNSH